VVVGVKVARPNLEVYHRASKTARVASANLLGHSAVGIGLLKSVINLSKVNESSHVVHHNNLPLFFVLDFLSFTVIILYHKIISLSIGNCKFNCKKFVNEKLLNHERRRAAQFG
jgi:hypothetical protein